MSLNLQDYQLPADRIAFAFSDASGTNACVAMRQLQILLGKSTFSLFSNRNYFPSQLKSVVGKELKNLNKSSVDLLFTGTSHPESSDHFEVNFIRKAKAEGIPVISFIDHWVNFKLRFEGLSADELPDEIWVIDSRAADLAKAEGLPTEKIKIKGNPYHFFLKKYWVPEFQNKNYFETVGIPSGYFHILFAPDPLSIRDIHLKTGFTEIDALKDVLEIVSSLKNSFLIIKIHPLQPLDKMLDLLKDSPVNFKVLQQADNCELIHASDLVIGFYSNLLLEARALGRKVIRYFPGNQQADLLKDSNYFTSVSTGKQDLRVNLLKAINEKYSFP